LQGIGTENLTNLLVGSAGSWDIYLHKPTILHSSIACDFPSSNCAILFAYGQLLYDFEIGDEQ